MLPEVPVVDVSLTEFFSVVPVVLEYATSATEEARHNPKNKLFFFMVCFLDCSIVILKMYAIQGSKTFIQTVACTLHR